MDLLNAHLQVGIGMERYKTRYFERDVDRVRDLFTFERFFDFREGDTNIVPSAAQRWANFYDSIRHKMDDGSLSVIGDKPLAAPPITALIGLSRRPLGLHLPRRGTGRSFLHRPRR